MDELYASKPSESEADPDAETEAEEPESVDEESESEPTALLPKSAFGGKVPKAGQTVTLRIVKDYGDEVEVCPCKGEQKSMANTSDEEIDAMDTEEPQRKGMM